MNAFRIALASALVTCLVASPVAEAKRRDPVARTLARLARNGPFTAAEVAGWKRDWRRARPATRGLHGEARRNLSGVLANTRSLASRRMLGGRARAAFLTLRHNLAWFAEQRRTVPANGSRRGFGSELVWQLYTGSGWQLQPLATFGRLNGLASRRGNDVRIRALVEELLPLGVSRRGFLAFEYLFPWSGRPGWVSGMSQATGMQALARAADRLEDPRLMRIAGRMRGAFETPAPWGVRRRTGRGRAHYLLYSHLPRLLVGNAFAQALIGLDEYRERSGDARAERILDEGLAQARRNLPRFDTGAWSLYYRTPGGPGTESDLHYHRLFGGFLDKLCDRFAEPFCRLHDRFATYESEPVVITRLRARSDHQRLSVRLHVSKRSSVTVTVRSRDRTIDTTSRSLLRGPERFDFSLPRRRHPISVKVEVTSLTGVRSWASVEAQSR